jgi:serine/threonine protein kinase
MTMRFLVIDGADQGRSFPLIDEGILSVGSSRRNTDICLHDLHVRRVHCQIEIEGGRVVVTAEEDSASTYVNGQAVRQQLLHPGDVLRVGNSHLRLQLDDDEEEEAAEEEEAEAEAPVDTKLPHLPHARLGELSDHTLAHYKVGAVLGQGHCGVVFRARDLKGGQTVALKVLSPEFPKGAGEMQRFIDGLKKVLPLRHAHLVNLFNAGKTGPYCWIALEYIEGESVAQALERLGTKPNWKHALRLAVHGARALDVIHGQRLLHGNITPRNLLVRLSDKVVKLADLMMSQALEGSALQAATLESKLLAEMPFLSPEQVDPNAYVDQLSDIYSLGAVVYARLTGQPPFKGASPEETIALIREGPLLKPTKHNPAIPVALETTVVKMLARQQEHRHPTAADLLKELERIAVKEDVPV